MATSKDKKNKLRVSDIAERAGVSTATVDRVIHNRPGVKPHTANHIRAVMDEMGDMDVNQTGPRRRPGVLNFDIILPKGTNTFFNTLEDEINQAQDNSDQRVAITVHRIEGFNPRLLARAVLEHAEHSDGIALVAIEDPIVREAVQNTVDAGVPVVTLVSDLSNARHHGYIGLDNRAAGRTAGYLMSRLTPKQGSVLMIAGSISLRDHEEREMGFRRALGEHRKSLKIIARLEDHDDYRTTYDETRKVMKENPDLVGIYNIGAGNRGIASALQEAGRESEITFIGHELTSFSRQYLIEGVMDVVIDQSPGSEASQLVDALVRLNQPEPDAADIIPLEVKIYFKENLP